MWNRPFPLGSPFRLAEKGNKETYTRLNIRGFIITNRTRTLLRYAMSDAQLPIYSSSSSNNNSNSVVIV